MSSKKEMGTVCDAADHPIRNAVTLLPGFNPCTRK